MLLVLVHYSEGIVFVGVWSEHMQKGLKKNNRKTQNIWNNVP